MHVLLGKLLIDNVIKGQNYEKELRFLVNGGTITVKEYENSLLETKSMQQVKIPLSSMTDEEKMSKFIEFRCEDYIEFNEKQRYILFLNKIDGTNDYMVVGNYGMIEILKSDEITNIKQIKEIINRKY